MEVISETYQHIVITSRQGSTFNAVTGNPKHVTSNIQCK